MYNTTLFLTSSFERSIIIVITPQSTGPQSILFWVDAVQNYVLFNQLSDAQELIQRQGIENWVSEMQTGYHNYITLLDNIQRTLGNTSRTVLGITTSILSFNTMNRLYFEEFRRAILSNALQVSQVLRNPSHLSLCSTGCFYWDLFRSVFLMVEIVVAFLVSLLFTGLSLYSYMSSPEKKQRCPCLF